MGNVSTTYGNWGSFMNGVPFVRAWDRILNMGKYWNYSWTVKVDPDTVFVPNRLRPHLQHMPAEQPCWVRNWDHKFGLLGPIEVFSALGVQLYGKRKSECIDSSNHGEMLATSGEDGWIATCMGRTLQVRGVRDLGILDCTGDMNKCWWSDGVPARHPFKDPDNFRTCLDRSISVG
uniref:Hexosyltransferase n=1 Tax=Alexandrium monilatum TaxID=311494 RepID=A0A7S4RGZ0_9DINO